MVNIFACPEGIQRITSEYPDVHIVVAKIDEALTTRAIFYPARDAGDRVTGPMTISFRSISPVL